MCMFGKGGGGGGGQNQAINSAVTQLERKRVKKWENEGAESLFIYIIYIYIYL